MIYKVLSYIERMVRYIILKPIFGRDYAYHKDKSKDFALKKAPVK